MTAIVVKAFNGLKPIVDPRLLDNGDAQVATNVRLISGSLSPLKSATILKATTLYNPATIFRYGNSATETDYWLEFQNDTDVMRSPIANDQYDRLYWTDGDNRPRYAPNSLILSGNPYPGSSYELGIPKPGAKPTASGTAVPTYTTVTRDYVLTFYAPSTGKESAATKAYSVQAVDGFKVTLSNLTTDNRGDATITKKRLYRKVDGTFRRVAEIDLATTTYEDSATDASIASAPTLPSALGSAPPSPSYAPSVTAATANPTAAAVSRQYVYTVKNFSVAAGDGGSYTVGESLASAPVSISADSTQTVTITNFNNDFGGTHFRIYRKDPSMSQYQLVAEIPVSQTSVQDVIATTVLGATLSPDGFQTPSTTPIASANGSTAVSTVKRIYMLTFVDSAGNESAKGPVSSVVNVVDGQTTVYISHSETIPAGVTKKRLYRQNVTVTNGLIVSDDANWKFAGEASASATSATDTAADSTLTQGLPVALQNLPTSPTGTPVIAGDIPAKVVPETRVYVYTYVSAYGEEGAPSDASDSIEIDAEKTVTVTMAGPPTGNYNITLKRIYRSSTVGSRAAFQFVAEVPVAQTTYDDTVTQADLGEVLPTDGWLQPPAGLKGLRMMANGVAVGFVGRTVYMSEPNLPHAWPHQYPVDSDIVAVGTFGQSVVVLTKSYPYVFSGIDPAAMASTKLPLPQACLSKRSMLETGNGVVYASGDGLVSISSGGIDIITKNVMSREQWQAYVPSSMDAYPYNGRILLTYNTGSAKGILMFDLSGQGAFETTSDINATNAITGGYLDPRSGILYLAQNSSIVRFDQGTALTMLWRSKQFRLGFPENLGVAQVRAAAWPVTLRIYAGSALVHTQTVTDANQFRLPSGFRSVNWEFEIESTNTVTEVAIAQSSVELKAV